MIAIYKYYALELKLPWKSIYILNSNLYICSNSYFFIRRTCTQTLQDISAIIILTPYLTQHLYNNRQTKKYVGNRYGKSVSEMIYLEPRNYIFILHFMHTDTSFNRLKIQKQIHMRIWVAWKDSTHKNVVGDNKNSS